MKKAIKYLLIILSLLYVLLLIVIYSIQERLLFNPTKLSEHHRFRTGQEIEIRVAEDISLNTVLIDTPRERGVILYLHGNRGSNRRCLRQALVYDGLGFDILMPDYRGYGKSDGEMSSQSQAYSDVQKVYDYLKEIYGENKIVILGYSLGSGMASYLASQNNPAALHLVASYKSLIAMKNKFAPFLPSFLLKYPFKNDDHLKKVNCPVTLYHAPDDELIPFDHGKALSKINPTFKLVTLNGTGHRGSIFHQEVRKNI